jgi:hypothetical protein
MFEKTRILNRSYVIPIWELKVDAKKKYREKTIDILTKRLVYMTGKEQISIRELTSSDLGLTSWRTPGQPANQRTTWVNHELPGFTSIAIYGLSQLTIYPKVSELRIGAGVSGCIILGLHDIEKLYSALPIIRRVERLREDGQLKDTFGSLENIRMEAYFAEPYVWDQAQVVWLETKSFVDNPRGDRLMLLGFVAEVLGVTLASASQYH